MLLTVLPVDLCDAKLTRALAAWCSYFPVTPAIAPLIERLPSRVDTNGIPLHPFKNVTNSIAPNNRFIVNYLNSY